MTAFREELWPAIKGLKDKTSEMNVKLRVDFRVGDPVNTVIKYASNKEYGLIVVPSEYRADGRIGAVAEDIARSIKLPMLIVMRDIT